MSALSTADLAELTALAVGSGNTLAVAGDDDETASRVERRRAVLDSALLDATELHKLPKPTPLVDGIVNRDTLCWLQGKPGHGKSFIALDLACHIATGRPWRDRPVTQGRVLYIVAEGASGMQQRLHAWEIGNQTRIAPGTVLFLPVAVQFLDSLDVAALRELVTDVAPVLIVVDTQARVTVNGEENSSKDMGRFVDAADQLKRASGGTVMVVHHEARNGDNLRGSTAMEGAADTQMRAKKDGVLVELTCVKQKEGAEFDPIYGTLVGAGESVYWSHGTLGLTLLDTDNENKIYAAMRDLFGSTGASTSKLIEATGLATSSFHRARESLVRKGKLRNAGSVRRTLWVLADEEQQVIEP